jgi:predicted ester cyclase
MATSRRFHEACSLTDRTKEVAVLAKAPHVVAASVEAFNAHDEERVRSLYADDVVLEAPGNTLLKGPDAFAYLRGWPSAFPDAPMSIRTVVTSGSWVAHRFVFEGTQEETLVGPDGEIPAGSRVETEGAQFLRVEHGKIVEIYLCFDQLQVLNQLGVMPEAAAPA